MDLNTVWFNLLIFLIIGYAVLDGFDLGVGIFHLFVSDEEEKRLNMNAIAPVWDGNEVWLLAIGGVLFAVFPPVYAAVLSGMYSLLVLLVVALIFRAVSLEFRGLVDSSAWRRVWDLAFGAGSVVAAFLLGIVAGNLLRGIPLSAEGFYTGSIADLLNPYALFTGVLTVVMFLMHGVNYLTVRAEFPRLPRLRRLAHRLWLLFAVCSIIAVPVTILNATHIFVGFSQALPVYLFLTLFLAAVIYQPLALKDERYFQAFLCSASAIAMLIALAAAGMYPRLVWSIGVSEYGLTIYNAASTSHSQFVSLIIVLIGLPLVIAYTAFIYTIFRGRVGDMEDGY